MSFERATSYDRLSEEAMVRFLSDKSQSNKKKSEIFDKKKKGKC